VLRPNIFDAFMVLKNGTRLGYPWLESILAVLPFVNKFWIEDGYSTDDTYPALVKLQERYPDQILLSRYLWPHMQTGFAIGAATQHLLDQIHVMPDMADWLLYVQADELWHPHCLGWIKKLLEYEQRFDAVEFKFLHLAHNYQELQFPVGQESYTHAIRLVRNKAQIRAHRDAWTFEGCQDVVRAPETVRIVHANSTHWLNYAAKARSHADTLYPDLPFYKVAAEERERDLAAASEVPELWRRPTSPYAEFLPAVVLPTIGWPQYFPRRELL
jgi:hypothetical protein